MHNETINIWTHLLACIGFVILAINLIFSKDESNLTKIPIYAFLTAATFQLLVSTIMHMFCSLS